MSAYIKQAIKEISVVSGDLLTMGAAFVFIAVFIGIVAGLFFGLHVWLDWP